MRRRRVLLTTAVIIVFGAVLGLWRWWPPSDTTQAGLKAAIVRYDLAWASSSVRPAQLVGKKLTPADKKMLQQAWLDRLEAAASGQALNESRDFDYTAAFASAEWHTSQGTRELINCSGTLIYWDFLHRKPDGSVLVRAGVAVHFKEIVWNPDQHKAISQEDWAPCIAVQDYTLKKIDGTWKVTATKYWRWYDPATKALFTGAP